MEAVLAQDVTFETEVTGGPSPVFWIVWIAIWVVYIAAYWRIFTKAGQPGWAAIIPFYNWYVVLKIVGRPGWWLILFFIPIVNIVILIVISIDLARSFGKGTGFGLGLAFLSIIFAPILAWGDATYQGPSVPGAAGPTMAPPPPPPPPPTA